MLGTKNEGPSYSFLMKKRGQGQRGPAFFILFMEAILPKRQLIYLAGKVPDMIRISKRPSQLG
jgi:hypothetical protein